MRTLKFLSIVLIFFLGLSISAQEIKEIHTEDESYSREEILIKYRKDAVNLSSFTGRIKSRIHLAWNGLSREEDIQDGNITVARIDPDETIESTLAQLSGDARIEYAQPNYIYEINTLDTDDTHRLLLWGLDSTDDQDIDAPEAWQISEGNGVIVAVIDTGVAYNHPDLAANMWDGTTCLDENGASLGGCLHGYDYEGSGDTNPLPTSHTHGTHVAGTIAAIKNNTHGIIGVAPRAQIMALKTALYTDEIIKSIAFAKYNGAKIINASWGGTDFDQLMYDAIAGFPGLFVAAAGNSGSDNELSHHYPSDYTLPNILSVAATTESDTLAGFSSYGATSVDLGAPGAGIYSTIVTQTTILNESLSTATPPAFPAGYSSTGNWGTMINGGFGNAAIGDTNQFPYSPDANSTLSSGPLLLSGKSANISFYAQCDTKYILTGWEDYMALEYSSDGVNFMPAYDPFFPISDFFWDEAYLDFDRNESGSAGYTFTSISIPDAYMTDDFRFRFRWVTDTSDNNYAGCFIDNILIKSFGDGSGEEYGYLSGTSMAAPHVAGAAALLWSYNPGLTGAQIKSALMNGGDSLPALDQKTVSGKRLNAVNALNAVNPSKSITAFSFPSLAQNGIINESLHTINFNIVETDITALSPLIVFTGVSVSPLSGLAQDFSNPIVYTVTAADGSTLAYEVTVTIIPDKTLLIQAITDEIGIDHHIPVYRFTESDYTPSSWSAYTESINQALLAEEDIDATNLDISSALSGIQSALSGLIFAGQANFDTIIDTASALIQGDYTTLSWATIDTALALPQSTNAEIVAKTLAIESAISGLIFAGQADLDSVIGDINALNESLYTPASWTLFVSARDSALTLPQSTNALVNTKRTTLNNAVNILVYSVQSTPLSQTVMIEGPSEVVIQNSVTNPSLNLAAYITAGTGVIPSLSLRSENAANISLHITSGTTVTSADTLWDGIFHLPTLTTVTLPSTSGVTKTLSLALDLGDESALTFDRAIRILLPGESGKSAGYIHTGIPFTEITTTCAADDQAVGDGLPAGGDCRIDNGSDLVIWTKHLTTFATYTQVSVSPPSTGGGGGGGGGVGSGGGGFSANSAPKPSTSSTQSFLDFLPKEAQADLAKLRLKNPAHRLSTITIASGLAQLSLPTSSCQGWYRDIPRVGYACQVIEASAREGLISRANTHFRPTDTITRAEAYSVLMKSICLAPSTESSDWRDNVAIIAHKQGFTVRVPEAFEPDRELLVSEMFAIVGQMVKYQKEHPDGCKK